MNTTKEKKPAGFSVFKKFAFLFPFNYTIFTHKVTSRDSNSYVTGFFDNCLMSCIIETVNEFKNW